MKMDYSRNTASRMFASPFLEACSKVHPATPFAFYLPILAVLLSYGFTHRLTTLGWTMAFFPLGVLTWDGMEYLIHRHFFHWEGSGPFTRKLHEVSHGYHHRYPDDATRLVMPLGASLPLAILIFAGLYLLGRPAQALPFYCGIVCGYLFYDFVHWSTHYRTPLTAWGKAMRAHHMTHHFATHDKNYGISHRWIDWMVGTLKRR